MIYGAILDKGERFTYLCDVFPAIGNVQNEYNWLITDCVTYHILDEVQQLGLQEYTWISGSDLTKLADRYEFQLIWGVLSGFQKDIPLEKVLEYPLPYADGNPNFWKTPLTMEHPLAEVQIVGWDSTLTLLHSRHKHIIDAYHANRPESEDLLLYNKQFLNE